MELGYGTPPRRARGCEVLALRTDLWMKTAEGSVCPSSLALGTHGRQGVWPGLAVLPPPQPGTMLRGMPRGFLLGCATPDTFPAGVLRLRDPARARGKQGCEICCVATGTVPAGGARAAQAAPWGRCRQTQARQEAGLRGPGLVISRSALFPLPLLPQHAWGSRGVGGFLRTASWGGLCQSRVVSDLPSSHRCWGDLLLGRAGWGAREEEGGAGGKVRERKIAALSRPAPGCALARQKTQNWEYSQVPLSEEAGSPAAGRGACQGSLLPPHAASSPAGRGTPRADVPARAPLPGVGLAVSPAHGTRRSTHPHRPRELAQPPSMGRAGGDRLPIGLPQL